MGLSGHDDSTSSSFLSEHQIKCPSEVPEVPVSPNTPHSQLGRSDGSKASIATKTSRLELHMLPC